MKPNLFIIGASKCATTSLWDILGRHPDIYMSHPKEPSFFVKEDYKDKIEDYLSLYKGAENKLYAGEASPIYSQTIYFPDTARRIYEFNPDARIIYAVRNPIDRLQSVWIQNLSTGHWYREMFKMRFGLKEIGLMSTDFEKVLCTYPSFMDATRYWTHINSYRQHFSDKHIHVMLFEEFVNHPKKAISKIFDFLDVENSQISNLDFVARNQGSEKKRYPFWFKKLPGNSVQLLEKMVPSVIRNRFLKKEIITANLFTSDRCRKVLDELESEISSILHYAGKDKNFWSIQAEI